MEKNMSRTEQVVRVVIGLALLAWWYTSGNLIGLIGIIPLLTGAVGYCPLYTLIGRSLTKP